jgi:hypothetical protein
MKEVWRGSVYGYSIALSRDTELFKVLPVRGKNGLKLLSVSWIFLWLVKYSCLPGQSLNGALAANTQEKDAFFIASLLNFWVMTLETTENLSHNSPLMPGYVTCFLSLLLWNQPWACLALESLIILTETERIQVWRWEMPFLNASIQEGVASVPSGIQ